MANDPTPVPAGAIQIEDDDARAPAPAVPPVAAAPADPPAVAAADDTEIDLTDPELAKDQTRINGLIAELARKRQEVRVLKPRATEAEQLREQLAQNQPYVEFLKANPQLLQPRTDPTPAATSPQEDTAAINAAKLYDFYTADGKPDATRGRAHLDLVRQQALEIAQQQLQPMQRDSATQQAQANYTALLAWKDDAGQPVVEKAALDAVWRQMINSPGGLETLATREGAMTAGATAAGFQRLMGKKPVTPPPHPPLHTEPSGGGPSPARVTMTEQSARIAQERNWKPEDYAKLTKNFVKGRSTVLEDN